MVPLTTHFTLDELCASQVASRLRVDNTPDDTVRGNLRITALNMEIVRQLLGNRPIHVSSGYRSPKLNAMIGGAQNPPSAHTRGWAVDFTCPDFGSPFDVATYLEKNALAFDQLIYEFRDWVHISFAPPLRRDVLTIFTPSEYLRGIVAEAS